ncbi:dynein heavy chain 17, axonemal-like isoform X3 [Melanotaenia boesemani]|uniref:dynein heavy chain 17, axonemal-like isoform X3 n=1 Tax=Melanotaenia boesemani TaxID=1250792 RepID=UPI001C051CC3|nr:dynein heavy chain 17, axonemal-like isoform X3 [Melanotaenia boesemani]
METEQDGPLTLIRTFTLNGLRLDPDRWQEFLSKKNTVTLSGFCSSQDRDWLFLHLQPDSGLRAGLQFPLGVQTKVLCVSKTVPEVVTKETCRRTLRMQETRGGDPLSHVIGLTEEVTCLLLSNAATRERWSQGIAEGALRILERQKNAMLVMKAQVAGHTFLPHPALYHHGNQDYSHHSDGRHEDSHNDHHLHHEDYRSDHHDNGHHDNSSHVESGDLKLPDETLLHACQKMVVEWAELVSKYLQQDWSRLVLDRLSPLPGEEFTFWKNRLQNLLFLHNQLMSPRAQQVAAILQAAGSVYWSTLRTVYRDIQEGVQEAQDIVDNLAPVLQKLEDILQVDFQQLKGKASDIMEEVCLLWGRSKFYCKPERVVVLLQEICNQFIHLSGKFLCGQEVMRALVSAPGPVLEDVRLVIQTLNTLKEAYAQSSALLDNRTHSQDTPSHSWDIPSHLVFFHLDRFMKRLLSIKEVLSVCLQVYQLDQMVLSGVSSTMWTDAVQQVLQEFLLHTRRLSGCCCDPTDPEDLNFEKNLNQFLAQVLDLETWLVSVLSRALEDCSDASSAAKNQLHPLLSRLVKMIQIELAQIELQFYSQKDKLETFYKFRPAAPVGLLWIQQLLQRTGAALKNYLTFQNRHQDSSEGQLVQNRIRQILDLLQDFRESARSDWSAQLDSDCGFIQRLPLIQTTKHGLLEVSCSHRVESVLKGLRYVCRKGEVELRPHIAQLLPCRDDITQTYLRLSHMVSCYNQVFSDTLQVERPLIQDQLQDLNQTLTQLQKKTWSPEGDVTIHGVDQLQTQTVLMFCCTLRETRTNMEAMTTIAQGWAELDLLQRSHDYLLEGGVTEHTCRRIREEGQQLLKLIQVNRSLYKAQESSQTWIDYLDHIDNEVQDGLFQLLHRALHFLSDSMNPQTSSSALLAVRLQLQETGSAFEPLLDGGLSDFLKTTICDIYATAALPPRISRSRHGNYQLLLQQNPGLCALEQEVLHELQQVREEAEHLREGLDRYSHLWLSDRKTMFKDFLKYGRQLAPEELEAGQTPPTLNNFHREMESLSALSSEVSHLDDVIILHGWLQVDLRPFRTSLLSIIYTWRHMYTNYLLESVSNSMQVHTEDEESPSSSTFSVKDIILLLEAAAVELPKHLTAQLQC